MGLITEQKPSRCLKRSTHSWSRPSRGTQVKSTSDKKNPFEGQLQINKAGWAWISSLGPRSEQQQTRWTAACEVSSSPSELASRLRSLWRATTCSLRGQRCSLAHCLVTDGNSTRQRWAVNQNKPKIRPLPSVKLPVRVMTTNTLPSGSKSTWKSKGNVRRLFWEILPTYDNIWSCMYSQPHP